MTAEVQPTIRVEGPNPNIQVPLFKTIEVQALANNPGHQAEISRSFVEMNRQFIDNYRIVHAGPPYSGVTFAYTEIVIDQGVVEQIGGLPHRDYSNPSSGRNTEEFCFTQPAAAPPGDGGPETVADELAYLFFQKLGDVAGPMARGEVPAKVTIGGMGLITGPGGTTTKDFNAAVSHRGFEPVGEVYAQLIAERLAGVNPQEIRIRLQSPSMGAATSSATSRELVRLMPDLQSKIVTVEKEDGAIEERETEVIKRMWDSPGGIQEGNVLQRGIKGINLLGIGLDIVKAGRNPLVKGLSQAKKEFYDFMRQSGKIPQEEKGQGRLRAGLLWAEAKALGSGTHSESAFVVTSRLDTANTKLGVIRRILTKNDKPLIMYKDGLTHVTPLDNNSSHAFNLIGSMLKPERIGRRLQVLSRLRDKNTSPSAS